MRGTIFSINTCSCILFNAANILANCQFVSKANELQEAIIEQDEILRRRKLQFPNLVILRNEVTTPTQKSEHCNAQ